MNAVLMVSAGPGEWRAGLFHDGEAVELMIEREQRQSLVGAVFLARIIRVLPALRGAFLDIGQDQPAFLPDARRLAEGTAALVQVRKDAFEDKAPEVSTAIELAGRYCVWTPYRPGIAASRQLAREHRSALTEALAPLIHDAEGVLLRSEAETAGIEAMQAEIEALRGTYAAIRRAARKAQAPARLDAAPTPLDRLILPRLGEIALVVIDDRASPARIKARFGLAASFVEPRSPELAALDESFATALAPVVMLPEGGRLRFGRTAAFITIDVDLGGAAATGGEAGAAIRRMNLAAARRLVRELRLRNIGGAVVVDFISMAERRHRQEVEAAMAAEAADDPAGIEFHGWTRLDHFELTRRRIRPSLADLMLEPAGDRQCKTAATVGIELLRAFRQLPYAAGGYVARVEPDVARALDGELGEALAAAKAGASLDIRIEAEPGRFRESFDIAPA